MISVLRWLFPRTFLWNGGISPFNGRSWIALPWCEDGSGVWTYTDGDLNIHFFGRGP